MTKENQSMTTGQLLNILRQSSYRKDSQTAGLFNKYISLIENLFCGLPSEENLCDAEGNEPISIQKFPGREQTSFAKKPVEAFDIYFKNLNLTDRSDTITKKFESMFEALHTELQTWKNAWTQNLRKQLPDEKTIKNKIGWETTSKWITIISAIGTLGLSIAVFFLRFLGKEIKYDEIAFFGTLIGAIIALTVCIIFAIINGIVKRVFHRKYGVSLDIAKKFKMSEEEYIEQLREARRLCGSSRHHSRRNMRKAKRIYRKLLDNEPSDPNCYVGLLNICSKNFTVYFGKHIEEYMQAVEDWKGDDNYSRLEKDYKSDYEKYKEHVDHVKGTEPKAEEAYKRLKMREKMREKRSLLATLFFILIVFVGTAFLLMVVISFLEYCPVIIPAWLSRFTKILNPLAFSVGVLGLSTFGVLTLRTDTDIGKYLLLGSLVFFTSWGIIWLCNNYIFVNGWNRVLLVFLTAIDVFGGITLLVFSWKSHLFTNGGWHWAKIAFLLLTVFFVAQLPLWSNMNSEKDMFTVGIVCFGIFLAVWLFCEIYHLLIRVAENRSLHFFRDLIMVGFWPSIAFSAIILLFSLGIVQWNNMFTDGNFEYKENEDGTLSFITTLHKNYDTIEIPSEVDGRPVVGIVFSGDHGEGGGMYAGVFRFWHSARVVIIPDSVVHIDFNAFCYYRYLESIIVSEDNAVYSSKDGILYDKEGENVIIDPKGIRENISGVSWNSYRPIEWGYRKRDQLQ